jgi:hypothetical protein
MLKNKTTALFILLIFFIIFFPFYRHDTNDLYEAVEVDGMSIGYYQSTTCNISLYEVYLKNLRPENIQYNAHNYAGIECFGKITGVDKVNDTFIVSVGTNSSLSFMLQLTIWCLLLFIIKKSDRKKLNPTNLSLLIIPIIYTFQHISENRFYSIQNKYFDIDMSLSNYYLLTIFLSLYIFCIIINILLEERLSNFINYIPFTFLIIGTFNGLNLNFYILLLSIIGINNLKFYGFNTLLNKTYLAFSFFWVFSRNDDYTFFDGDKIRGLINTSNTLSSQIYWILIIGLVLNGLSFLFENSSINTPLLIKNFLISGSLLVLFGLLGANSSLINILNFYIFGQNKVGMRSIDSIAGNTWRGFSASAESAGEFYAFILLFYIICLFYKKINFTYFNLPMLVAVSFGLYKTNNFAAFSSLIVFSIIAILYPKLRNKVSFKSFFVGVLITAVAFSLFILSKYNYTYLSTELLYEASQHSNFYPNLSNYEKYLRITEFFDNDDVITLFSIENPGKASSTLSRLINISTPDINIPLLPNPVLILSTTSILINRTEMWGIFLAKYSPNLVETFFGNGPYQLNNYLYLQEIRLDLPENKLSSLFLPHSSLADLIIFSGLIGVLLFLYTSIKFMRKNYQNNSMKILLLFLLVNFLKSDSLLYINSVLLLFLSYFVVKFKESSDA